MACTSLKNASFKQNCCEYHGFLLRSASISLAPSRWFDKSLGIPTQTPSQNLEEGTNSVPALGQFLLTLFSLLFIVRRWEADWTDGGPKNAVHVPVLLQQRPVEPDQGNVVMLVIVAGVFLVYQHVVDPPVSRFTHPTWPRQRRTHHHVGLNKLLNFIVWHQSRPAPPPSVAAAHLRLHQHTSLHCQKKEKTKV